MSLAETSGTHGALSLSQRMALGLLARGPLFQGPGAGWTSAIAPGESAHDLSVRALVKRGLCHIALCETPAGTGRMAQATFEGRAHYTAISGRYAAPPRLPPEPERIMAEMGEALAAIEAELMPLMQGAEQIICELEDAQAAVDRAVKHAGAYLARLRRLAEARRIVSTRCEAITDILADRTPPAPLGA